MSTGKRRTCSEMRKVAASICRAAPGLSVSSPSEKIRSGSATWRWISFHFILLPFAVLIDRFPRPYSRSSLFHCRCNKVASLVVDYLPSSSSPIGEQTHRLCWTPSTACPGSGRLFGPDEMRELQVSNRQSSCTCDPARRNRGDMRGTGNSPLPVTFLKPVRMPSEIFSVVEAD